MQTKEKMEKTTTDSMQAHEIIVVVFKPGISYEEQAETMKRIGENSSKTEGFVSRQIFYTDVEKRWIDYIIWRDMAAADASIEDAKAFPESAELFGKIDQEKSVWSRYKRVE